VKHFLIVFDRSAGSVLRLEAFDDPRLALRERFMAERIHRGDSNIEVVVLGANSAAALRATHARYFASAHSLTDMTASRLSGYLPASA
jgi:hypothetical protein